MTTTIMTCYGTNAKQIKPAVVNLFQANNATDKLEFQITKYQQDNVDLSTLDPYVICHGNEFIGGLDEVKLTSEVTNDGILRVYWDITLMTLSSPQTITAQLVFKNNGGDVWTSYKFILFCNESLTADEEIVAQYPTILKQMETRIDVKTEEATQGATEELTQYITNEANTVIQYVNDMAEDFDASVVYIPYDEHVPAEERVNNRLYYQYTNADNTKGRFEDYNGNVLVSESTGGGGGLPMFAPIWSDHLYNDASYLRADNFSWHDANIYVTAYDKLLEEYNNEYCVEKTENGVTYKLTPAGFKIANGSQHDAVRLAYDNGKGWYYILDTDNARFKLPREKNGSSKYLYFYVGNYPRPETEVNIGILTEMANGTDISVIVEEINEIKNQAIAEVASYKQPLTTLTETSGTVTLEMDKIYSMVIDADTTFSLPTEVNTDYFNQIKVMVNYTSGTVDFGTTNYFNKTAPELEAGYYDIYFDYDNHLAGWVIGVLSKGVAE